jgi:hypothetical protein
MDDGDRAQRTAPRPRDVNWTANVQAHALHPGSSFSEKCKPPGRFPEVLM